MEILSFFQGFSLAWIKLMMTGLWLTYPSEKMSSSVGVTIPNWMESHKSHVPVTTNQMINAGYPET